MSYSLVNLEEIKGEGFTPSSDSLHEIKDHVSRVRSDTGELNDTVIANSYTLVDSTLTGNLVVNDLYLMDNVIMSGPYTVTVLRDCFIYSSRIDVNMLDIKGDLVIERDVGDTSYTNLLTVNSLNVVGNVTLKNTDYNIDFANIDGNLTIENCENVNTSDTQDIHVKGDMDVTGLTGDLVCRVNGDLTSDSLNGSIDIACNNFIYTASALTANADHTGLLKGGDGRRYNGASGPSVLGGEGARLSIYVLNTFTSTTLSTINVTATQGSNGAPLYGSGGAGGSCYCDLFATNSNFSNSVSLTATPGNGGNSFMYYGGGAAGVINANGRNGGNAGNINSSNPKHGGGASTGINGGTRGSSYYTGVDPVLPGNGNSTPCPFNVNIVNEQGQVITANAIVASGGPLTEAAVYGEQAGQGGANGSQTTNDSDIYSENSPKAPTQVTADDVNNPSTLVFTIPSHNESVNLDFEVVIQRQYTVKIYKNVYVHNTNDNAASFSGTPPYTQGSGNVTYTLPSLTSGTYQWKVKAFKDTDTNQESVYTDWRTFEIS